jgi:hypothetical protein
MILFYLYINEAKIEFETWIPNLVTNFNYKLFCILLIMNGIKTFHSEPHSELLNAFRRR